jgi:hypothetical protein
MGEEGGCVMTNLYTVSWVYRDGNQMSKDFDTFEESLEFYRDRRAGGALVASISHGGDMAGGPDGDYWDDGLTDEETEQL